MVTIKYPTWPWLPRCGLEEGSWCGRSERCPAKPLGGLQVSAVRDCQHAAKSINVANCLEITMRDWQATARSSKAGNNTRSR